MEIGQKINILYRTESIRVDKYLFTKANMKVKEIGKQRQWEVRQNGNSLGLCREGMSKDFKQRSGFLNS